MHCATGQQPRFGNHQRHRRIRNARSPTQANYLWATVHELLQRVPVGHAVGGNRGALGSGEQENHTWGLSRGGLLVHRRQRLWRRRELRFELHKILRCRAYWVPLNFLLQDFPLKILLCFCRLSGPYASAASAKSSRARGQVWGQPTWKRGTFCAAPPILAAEPHFVHDLPSDLRFICAATPTRMARCVKSDHTSTFMRLFCPVSKNLDGSAGLFDVRPRRVKRQSEAKRVRPVSEPPL